jgi:opacity protein-like surface antigen
MNLMSRLVSLSGFRALVASAALAALFASSTARADITPPTTGMGDKGQLWLDQLSGFRVGTSSTVGAQVDYYGPIGFNVTSVSEDCFGTNCNTTTTLHQTTFWLAPSADIFVIDHLSIGGLIEFSTTSASQDLQQGGTTSSGPLPSTTNFTFEPRAGWLFALSDRFGIWPRLGLGYASRQRDDQNGPVFVRDSKQGVILDLDAGFIWRITDSFFLKAAPDLAFLPGGSHSETLNNVSLSSNASIFQFSVVTGIGAIIDL